MDRVTNKEVLVKISEEMLLRKSIVKKRNKWIGLLNLTIERNVEWKNYWRRPRLGYVQQIMKDQRCDLYKWKSKLTVEKSRTNVWIETI